MKAKKLFIAVYIFCNAALTFAQTNVSGGIFTNATWTVAGSPYIVVDTVVVFPGVTLTIESGVEVRFNNNKIIENRGVLIAQGTVTDSIVFTSASVSPIKGIWGGIVGWAGRAKFEHCYFAYSDNTIFPNENDTMNYINCTFENNNIGVYYLGKNSIIESCKFINNTYGLQFGVGGEYGNRKVLNSSFINNNYGIYGLERTTIKNCNFDGNGIAIDPGNDDTIYQCTFTNNDTAISYAVNTGYASISENIIENNNYGLIVYNGSFISCNKICNNSVFNAKLCCTFNTVLTNNYWCSNDSAPIANTIYDGYDNIGLCTNPLINWTKLKI